MRMLTSTLVVILTGALFGGAQAQPKIELPAGTTVNLGTLYRGDVTTHTLTVANTGRDTLVVDQVRTSCGCTGTMLSASRIPPGGTGTLSLTLDTRNLSGAVTKRVAISSNSPEQPILTVEVLATVREEIVLQPRQVWFKDAEVGRERRVSLVVRNTGADTLTLNGYRSTMEGLTIDVPSSPIAPGGEVTLSAVLTPVRPTPVIADAIFLLTSNPRQPEVYIPVFGNATEFRFDQTGQEDAPEQPHR